jgi:hypothetical protein
VTDDAPAKIYSDQRTIATYLGDSGDGFTLPLKEKWRVPDAIAAVTGFLLTGAAVTANLTGGHALTIMAVGGTSTASAVWALSRLPVHRPSLTTRTRWWWANLLPRVEVSHPPPPPDR